MRTIKIVSGNLNNSYSEIPSTSIAESGKIRSLKKDGTFIEGRLPLEEEETLLWKFSLTTKEKINKSDTRLFATIYVPEEGVDIIDDSNKKKIGLFKHLSQHQNCCQFQTVVEGGVAVKKQINQNYRRNHLFYFEVIDESSVEEKRFNDSRIETKYRAIIDELFDKEDGNVGEFLDVCYGCGIVKPERNTKRQNYNLLVNKLQLNPENFKLYWDDENKSMVNVIKKGERTENPENKLPYITSNNLGLAFFNNVAIGKGIDEMKVYFRQHPKEYEYLVRVTESEKMIPKDISTKTVKTANTFTPVSQVSEIKADSEANLKVYRIINMEIGKVIRSATVANKNNSDTGKSEVAKTISALREKYDKHIDYFNKKLTEKAIQSGVAID